MLIIQALESFSPEEASGMGLMTKAEAKSSKIQRTGKRSSPGSSVAMVGGNKGNNGGTAAKGSGASASVCFLCGKTGQISTKCDIIDKTNDWVDLSDLPERVRYVASAVGGSIWSDWLSAATATPQSNTNCAIPLTDLSFNHNLVISFPTFLVIDRDSGGQAQGALIPQHPFTTRYCSIA